MNKGKLTEKDRKVLNTCKVAWVQIDCSLQEDEKALLYEIAHAQKDIEIWAYKPEKTRQGELLSFEYAIRQEKCWYELFERETLSNHEECMQLRMIKRMAPHTDTSQVPFNIYECVKPLDEKELEQAWVKMAMISYPFTVSVYKDKLKTFRERKQGGKEYTNLTGDVAIGFESEDTKTYIQITLIPFFLNIHFTEKSMENCHEIWSYHYSTESELEYLKKNIHESDEYYQCRYLKRFKRVKIRL